MCKSLLDLIATDKREEEKTQVLYPTSEALIATDIQYALDGFFERAEVPFNGNPVVYSPNPLTIGQQYLDDYYDLNVTSPTFFEPQSVNFIDVGVIDMPSIADVSEQFYLDIIPCNFYADPTYEFIGLEPCPPFSEQEKNYVDYVNRLTNNGNIFDVFAIFTGQKSSDTKLGLIGAQALNEHFERNLTGNAVKLGSDYLETSLFRFVQTNSILRLPYDITVPRTALGKTGLLLEKLSGAYFPFSYLPDDAFNLENKTEYSKAEYTRILLEYTGSGQKQELQRLLQKNLYSPSIIDNNFAVKGNEYLYIGHNAPLPFSVEFSSEYFNKEQIDFIRSADGLEPQFSDTIERYQDPVYGVRSISKNTSNPNLFSEETQFQFGYDENKDQAVWNRETENRFLPKSLLYKTKKIVNESSQVIGPYIDSTKREFMTQEDEGYITISKGDSVTAYGDWPIDDDRLDYQVKKGDFFRTWTKDRKYSKLNRAISHRGLFRNKPSVLNKNGLVNIAPTYRQSTGESIKRYMFSIENLAWADFLNDLPECEKGPGDLLNNIKGRIMWFPPYDLSISESVTPSWTEHDFIGRGEAVYSYNNTKRTASLSFTMIVDHPTVVNKIRAQKTEIWERYFKGDKSVLPEVLDTFNRKLTPDEIELINKIQERTLAPKKTNEPVIPAEQKKEKQVEDNAAKLNDKDVDVITVYFPNDTVDIPSALGPLQLNSGYQSSFQPNELDYTYYNGQKRDLVYEKKTGKLAYPNRTNYNLNNDFFNEDIVNAQIKFVLDELAAREATAITFEFYGYASEALPTVTTNYNLSLQRAENLKTWFIKKFNDYLQANNVSVAFNATTLPLSDFESPNTGDDIERDSKPAVEARRASVVAKFDVEPDDNINTDQSLPEVIVTDNLTQNANLSSAYPDSIENLSSKELLEKLFGVSECEMFDYMEVYEPMLYKTISEKIKYFQPAFHSMTPEGFNGRLNFLHQCTRQAQNIGVDGVDNLTNFAFGRPPVCILRIGDFFYTKVIIKSLGIAYDNPKWDLNPEGFVAPMIAKITMEIDIIGGQSLDSPINRLQNALSYNFYSSIEMFDPRADMVMSTGYSLKTVDDYKIVDGIKLNKYIKTGQLTDSSAKVDASKASSLSDTPVQNINSVTTPSTQNSVTSDIYLEQYDGQVRTIKLKQLLNLPLTQQEKQILNNVL